jgi:hypothetical protein
MECQSLYPIFLFSGEHTTEERKKKKCPRGLFEREMLRAPAFISSDMHGGTVRSGLDHLQHHLFPHKTHEQNKPESPVQYSSPRVFSFLWSQTMGAPHWRPNNKERREETCQCVQMKGSGVESGRGALISPSVIRCGEMRVSALPSFIHAWMFICSHPSGKCIRWDTTTQDNHIQHRTD